MRAKAFPSRPVFNVSALPRKSPKLPGQRRLPSPGQSPALNSSMLAGPCAETQPGLRDMPKSGRCRSRSTSPSLGRDVSPVAQRRRMLYCRKDFAAQTGCPDSLALNSGACPNPQARCVQQARQQARPIAPIVPCMLRNGAIVVRNAGSYRGPRRSSCAEPYLRPKAGPSRSIGALIPLAFKEVFNCRALETHGAADPNKGEFFSVAQALNGRATAIQKARNLALPQ